MQFFVEIAEFSRKFALKVRAEPYRLGLRCFFSVHAKVLSIQQVSSSEGLVQCAIAPGTSVACFESCTFWMHPFKTFNFSIFVSFS